MKCKVCSYCCSLMGRHSHSFDAIRELYQPGLNVGLEVFSRYPLLLLGLVSKGKVLKHRHPINFPHASNSPVSYFREKYVYVSFCISNPSFPFEHAVFVFQLHAVLCVCLTDTYRSQDGCTLYQKKPSLP